MTFAEYLQEVAKQYTHYRVPTNGNRRIGQTYMNVLHDARPDLYNDITDNAEHSIDPFYNDNNLADFLAYVEVNW